MAQGLKARIPGAANRGIETSEALVNAAKFAANSALRDGTRRWTQLFDIEGVIYQSNFFAMELLQEPPVDS
jgi:hypothetical protein